MKRLLVIVALLSMIPTAFAMQAYWTGELQMGQSVGGQYGFICTYRAANGNTFKLWFSGACPSSVEVN